MAERSWKTVWGAKALESGREAELEELLRIAGFSSPFGRLDGAKTWWDYTGRQASRLDLRPGDSLYEVGCGAGAFLYPFHQARHPVGGCDYSPGMVDAARRAMPGGEFSVLDAAEFPLDRRADVVVSNGVFLYFSDEDYAARVLLRMVAKARRSVGIFDVCDPDHREEALAARRGAMGADAYQAAYDGLDHLCLARSWFARVLAGHPVRLDFTPQDLEGYGNAPFRYNVYIRLTDQENEDAP